MISNTQRDFAKETRNFAFDTHFIIDVFHTTLLQKRTHIFPPDDEGERYLGAGNSRVNVRGSYLKLLKYIHGS